jgi:hypothetical protein
MKGHWISYSAEEMAWLEANRTLSIGDYHSQFVGTFSRVDVSASNLHSLRKRKGWKTGRTGCFEKGQVPLNKGKACPPGKGGRHPNARKTQFKKGALPHNTNYLGHERVSKDGYVEISVDERNPHTGFERRYVLKHKYLWEKANGPVPEGMFLKCLDGNRLNTDPSNWEMLPRAAQVYLGGFRGIDYEAASPEVRPAIIALAKLKHASKKARSKAAAA